MRKIILLLLFINITLIGVSAPVHTTYLWHLQQPIYWPDKGTWDTNRYQTCWESQWLKNNNGNWYSDGLQHPLNDLEDIFNKADRVAAYQWRPKDAVQTILGLSDAGAQVNYSGCLIENVQSLADAGQWGYSSGWQGNFQTARSWQTSGGNPRMDMTAFTFHHALAPLIDENALHKEIQTHHYIYSQFFGNTPVYSKGFWPAECSFSERIIQTLVEEGLEWSVIANSHLARTCQDYPMNYGTSGCNIDPPNPADILGPTGSNWWSGQIDGRGGTFAAPFCYQAHKAQYVDPETEQVYTIDVVPMGDVLSYMNGYGTMGTGEIDSHIAPYNDPSQPCIVLMAHDGDNAWGGGYDYYMNSVPNFANAAAAQGYIPSTVQQFLDNNPVPADDIVHVEDGSWVNAANDWGHPQFINWIWPMYDGNYQFDPFGWTEDVRNWAVITAAQNRVETAEDLIGSVDVSKIVFPDASANNAELAWHFFLPSLTSGYMYYGTSLDMEVKQTIACNNAAEYADYEINAHPGEDDVAPTIFIPQRFPYNPGGEGFGPLFGYQTHQNSSDFFVWTFAYDVSGLSSVELKYRIDNDGTNPLDSFDNEIYAGGSEVGSWHSITMSMRAFPTGNVTGNPDIDFFVLPDYMADEYYAEISGYTDCLVDYYVQAEDNHGNVKKSPIQHVYVGSGGGSAQGYVQWTPEEPQVEDQITITYGEDGSLFNVAQLQIHLGRNGWQNVDDHAMTYNAQDTVWIYSFTIENGTTVVDFCFNDGQGNWDNNNGQDWHVQVQGASVPFIMDGVVDAQAELVAFSSEIELWAAVDEDWCYVACTPASSQTDLFMMITSELTQLTSAPWAKAGQVAEWDLFLAQEGSNGYHAWYDNEGTTSVASNAVLEGYFSIDTELGDVDSFFIAIGEYETSDNGALIEQLPTGNGDGNIDFDEYFIYEIPVVSVDPPNYDNVEIIARNYPNPFSNSTTIKFFLTTNLHELSQISIYNVKGQLVRQLDIRNLDLEIYSVAPSPCRPVSVTWDSKDENGNRVSPSIYFYKVDTENASIINKMLLVR